MRNLFFDPKWQTRARNENRIKIVHSLWAIVMMSGIRPSQYICRTFTSVSLPPGGVLESVWGLVGFKIPIFQYRPNFYPEPHSHSPWPIVQLYSSHSPWLISNESYDMDLLQTISLWHKGEFKLNLNSNDHAINVSTYTHNDYYISWSIARPSSAALSPFLNKKHKNLKNGACQK